MHIYVTMLMHQAMKITKQSNTPAKKANVKSIAESADFIHRWYQYSTDWMIFSKSYIKPGYILAVEEYSFSDKMKVWIFKGWKNALILHLLKKINAVYQLSLPYSQSPNLLFLHSKRH